MSYTPLPFLLGQPYSESFDHETVHAGMGGGRSVRLATIPSCGLFRADGSLRVPQGSNTLDTLAALLASLRGAYDSFLYLPAHTYNRRSTSEAVGTGNASETKFALDYLYPKSGTFTVTVGGVAKAETTDWSLSKSDGSAWSLGDGTPYLKFNSAPGAAAAIVATYDFYVPVYFVDGDDLVRRMAMLAQATTSAASTLFSPRVSLEQDRAGSHLVTPPAV